MVQVKKYHLHPTTLVPNSPLPLLYYPGLLTDQASQDSAALRVHDIFAQNGWQVRWVFRYGDTQESHYHSATHEAMAVLSGEATIRFGVADDAETLLLSKDDDSAISLAHDGGAAAAAGVGPSALELRAQKGDVFVLPAGVAHKTYDPDPASAGLKLLTPGDGHRIVTQEGQDPREGMARVELDGFTMIGAYPIGARKWDYNIGGEHEGKYGDIWNVTKPEKDPVLGDDPDGLFGSWRI